MEYEKLYVLFLSIPPPAPLPRNGYFLSMSSFFIFLQTESEWKCQGSKNGGFPRWMKSSFPIYYTKETSLDY